MTMLGRITRTALVAGIAYKVGQNPRKAKKAFRQVAERAGAQPVNGKRTRSTNKRRPASTTKRRPSSKKR